MHGTAGQPHGTWAQARFALDAWMTPRFVQPGPESPGTADRPGGPSDTGTSYQGQLVETADTRTRARVTRDSWSTLLGLGYSPEFDGTDGPPRRPSATAPRPPRCLVETTVRPTRARVTRDSQSTRAFGHNHETPGRDGRPWPSDKARDAWDSWSTSRSFGPSPKLRGTVVQTRVPSDTSEIRPGQLVDPMGHREQAPVTLDSWSNPAVLRPKRETPGKGVRHRETQAQCRVTPER